MQNPAIIAAIREIILTASDILVLEDSGNKENIDTEKEIQERDEDSEIDQDGESSDDDGKPGLEFCVGKEKVTKWSKTKGNGATLVSYVPTKWEKRACITMTKLILNYVFFLKKCFIFDLKSGASSPTITNHLSMKLQLQSK